jgi:hypothetical protein
MWRSRERERERPHPVAELARVVVLLGQVEDHVVIAVMALEEVGHLVQPAQRRRNIRGATEVSDTGRMGVRAWRNMA